MKLKLGDICSFQSGGTPSKANADYFSGNIPWITTVALNGQTIGETAAVDWITEKAIEESAAKIVPARSIMVGTRVGVGKVAINEIPMSTSQDIISLVGINESLWNKEFLCKFIQSKEVYLKSQARGATIKGIKIDILASLDIPNIPFDSQKKIVAALDKTQSILTARHAQLAALDDLIKARFVEMFVGKGHPMIALDDLSLGKGEYGAQSASVAYDPKRPRYVRITDINDNGTLNDDVVSSANIEDDEQYRLTYGDFMFARMGATVGKTYAYKTGNQIFAGYLIRYRLNLSKITPEYLFAYTQLDEYKNWVVLNQSGAAQPGINAKKYGSLKIPVAPMDMQRAFQDFASQVDKSKVAVRKALDETQLLFDSLMQKYFC